MTVDDSYTIYTIKNIINGNCYVGSTVNVSHRFGKHRRALTRGVHPNHYLQNAWNKYGENSFTFNVVELAGSKQEMIDREQYYINTLVGLYNLSPTAGSTLGVKLKESTRRKMSIARVGEKNSFFGKTHTKEVRDKLADCRRNMPVEQREKLAALAKEQNAGFQPGEKHKLAKLRNEQVVEIKKILSAGDTTQRAIAKVYGVSEMAISDIKNGRRWASVG